MRMRMTTVSRLLAARPHRSHALRGNSLFRRSASFFLLAATCITNCVFAATPEPTKEQVRFFEEKVRPILAENCYKCHGSDKQKGSLRLDVREAVLAGGESGPVV